MISTWNLYCSETKTNVPLWVFKWVFQNLIIEKAIARIHEYIRGQQVPQIIHSYQNYWLEHYLMYVSSHTCRYMHSCLVFSLKLLINISPSILPLSSWSVLQVTEGTGCTLIAPLCYLLAFDNPLTPILYVTFKTEKGFSHPCI